MASIPAGRSTRWPWSTWLLALALLGLAACRSEPPEERLRLQFNRMQAAAEEKRPSEFMEGVSADFTGAGGMDRAALHNLMRARTLGNASIGATTGPLDVQVQGDNATVKFSVLLTGGGGRVLPDQMRTYQVTSGWRLEDGEWRVYYAQWDDDAG